MRSIQHRQAAVFIGVILVLLVGGACSPPSPTPSTTTVPPAGAVDVSGGLVAEAWRVGVPVDVPIYWPGHPGSAFSLLDGFLPPGVDLNGNRFVGTPTTAGFYAANLRASAGSASRTFAVRFGVVRTAPAPELTLPTNPYRGELLIHGCVVPSTEYCADADSRIGYYPAGQLTPAPQDVYSNPDSSTFRDGVWFRPILIGGTSATATLESGDCVLTVSRGFFGESGPPVAMIPSGLTAATDCSMSSVPDGSVHIVAASGTDPAGVSVTRVLFVRSSDGATLRTIDRGPSMVTMSTDGSIVFFSDPSGGDTIDAIGEVQADDRSYVVGNGDGRKCAAPENVLSLLRLEAEGRLVLQCNTPGQGVQIGYLDTRSGNLWLSEIAPASGSVATGPEDFFLWPIAGGLTISPDGTQIAAIGISARGPVTCALPGAFCSRKLASVGLYVDTGGDGVVREAFPGHAIRIDGSGAFGFAGP